MKGLSYKLFAVALLALVMAPSLAVGQSFTGADGGAFTLDTHYSLIVAPPLVPTPNVFSQPWPYDTWAPPWPVSNWINPWTFQNLLAQGGLYDYQTQFDLGPPLYQSSPPVYIEGQFVADNNATLWANVFFQNCFIAATPAIGFRLPYTHFVIPIGCLNAGMPNYLDFYALNQPVTATGLLAQFYCPPSPTLPYTSGGPPNPYVSLYYDGPVNASVSAWSITNGHVVSDTFTTSGQIPVSGFCFFAWVKSATEQPNTVQWSITAGENGGTEYGSGTASLTCVGYCKPGDLLNPATGFPPPARVCASDIYACTAAPIGPVSIGAGTYWFNLFNATTTPNGGAIVSWDQNGGAGCSSVGGCPSMASENATGTILPESFVLYGHP